MVGKESLGSLLEARGWAAGAVIPFAAVPLIQPYLIFDGVSAAVDHDDWLVIVSQTCDVVAPSLEQEPITEILHCKKILTIRRNFARLRSTRQIDLKPNKQDHPGTSLSAHATKDRYLAPRSLLATIDPDINRNFDAEAVRRIAAWYSLRYSRPVWPTTFVDRIGAYRQKFENALTQLEDNVEVRVSIVPRDIELNSNQDYRIAIWFVCDAIAWNSDFNFREAVSSAYSEFVSTLDSCEGVDVDKDESGPVSGETFSWQQTELSDEWNFANLSYSD